LGPLLYKYEPELDAENRPTYKILLTDRNNPSIGFNVIEAMGDDGVRFDTKGRNIEGSTYYYNSRAEIIRVHQTPQGTVYFNINSDYMLSPDEAAQIGHLIPLENYNRTAVTKEMPLMVEVDSLYLIENIARGNFEVVPRMQQVLLEPDWEKIREIDEINADLERQGKGKRKPGMSERKKRSRTPKIPICAKYSAYNYEAFQAGGMYVPQFTPLQQPQPQTQPQHAAPQMALNPAQQLTSFPTSPGFPMTLPSTSTNIF
jgi:hypothetical protein